MSGFCLLEYSADLIPEPIQAFSFKSAEKEARWSRTFPARNIYLVTDDLLQTTAGSESQRSQLASNQSDNERKRQSDVTVSFLICKLLNIHGTKNTTN